LHLSVERTRLIMRVQRELYNTPHEVAVFPGPVLLDQANALPYYGQVVGSYVGSPDSTGFSVLTDVYPIRFDELAASPSVHAPVNWELIPVVVVRDLGLEVGGSGSVTAPTAWNYIPVVVINDLGTEVAGSGAVSPPVAWSYIPVVVVKDLGTEAAASATVAAPENWNYQLVVVVYNGGVDVAASASVNPPVEWNYFV